jgi:CheY-like chemotaxis protein
LHNSKEVTQPANPRLLVADDARDLCHLVTKYLEAEGFTVSVVHTGAERIQMPLAYDAASSEYELSKSVHSAQKDWAGS